jgi:nicotinamide mononucleotide transporter
MEIDRLLADWGGSLLAGISIVCLFRKSLWYWYASLGSSALWFYLFLATSALMIAGLQIAYALFALYDIARWRREGASRAFDHLGTAIAIAIFALAAAATTFDGWAAYVEFAAVALSILANWLTAMKVVWCWPVWMSTNVLFALLFWDAGLWGLFTTQFLFFGLSFVGWSAWLRHPEPAAAHA